MWADLPCVCMRGGAVARDVLVLLSNHPFDKITSAYVGWLFLPWLINMDGRPSAARQHHDWVATGGTPLASRSVGCDSGETLVKSRQADSMVVHREFTLYSRPRDGVKLGFWVLSLHCAHSSLSSALSFSSFCFPLRGSSFSKSARK
jgi:hypothetical protein